MSGKRADSNWQSLSVELDRWTEAGRLATLWWRDDDACAVTPALERLLQLRDVARIPLGLAVIPYRARPALAERLRACRDVAVLQHGYAHCNHAPRSAKKAELGAHRSVAVMCDELARGQARLATLFRGAALPFLVPPWNRISDALVDELPAMGITGLSAYEPRRHAQPVVGLHQCNCHVDLIDWHGTRAYAGDEAVIGALVGHLRARREERVDSGEPTGVLSHHLIHDQGCWQFLRALCELTRRHGAVRWLDAGEAMCPA